MKIGLNQSNHVPWDLPAWVLTTQLLEYG